MDKPLMPRDPAHGQHMDEADQIWVRTLFGAELVEQIHPDGFLSIVAFTDIETGKRGFRVYDCVGTTDTELLGMIDVAHAQILMRALTPYGADDEE